MKVLHRLYFFEVWTKCCLQLPDYTMTCTFFILKDMRQSLKNTEINKMGNKYIHCQIFLNSDIYII